MYAPIVVTYTKAGPFLVTRRTGFVFHDCLNRATGGAVRPTYIASHNQVLYTPF